MTIRTLTNETFKSTIKDSSGVQLIKFGADWCGPCKAIEPTLNQLSSEYTGSADVFEIDVDKEPELASSLNIRGIPAVMIFKDGELQESLTGVQPIDQYREVLDRNIQ